MDTRRYANLGAKPLKYLKVSCTYDVKTTGSTKICYNTSGLVSMKVDGISTSKTTGYTFDSLGEHFVDFYLSGTTVPNVIFSGCTDMQYVEFEDGITSIGTNAFDGCNGLQCEIVIPDSVTSINNYAFNACYGITSLVLGENLINIGNYAFNGCNKITGDLVIPNSVTTIGEYAFNEVRRINALILGENITSIGRYAFAGCYYMENINFPNKLKTIANYAFSGCSYITEVNIPDSVTSIGSYAFAGCRGLTSVVIPNSVTSIGSYAFQNCYSLASVVVPDSVTSIGNYAFSYCTGLTGVEIGSGVTSISAYAFANCSGLTSVVIPDSVTNVGDYVFYQCSGLTSVEIGDGCTSIGNQVFHGCNRLTSVKIGDGCTSIGERAFYYCNKLTSVEIGSGCTSIGKEAFFYCQSLNKITCHAITAPTLSSDVFTYIGRYGTLIYPEGSDYSNWLQNSSNSYLGYYNWNEEYPVIIAKYNITNTTYSERLIYKTISVIKMFIDDIEVNVTNEYIFSTTGIHTVKYMVNQSDMVESQFNNCTSLLDISVGEGVRSIGNSSFSSCRNLKNVKLPSTLTTIRNSAFSYCDGLEKIELPVSLSSIANSAFNNCRSLREIICHSTTAPSISSATFSGIHSYGTLIYPEGSDYSNWLQNSSGYLGYYGWNIDEKGDLLKVTYNITDISTPLNILYQNSLSDRTYFGPTMYVDGVAKPISNTYLFDSVGTHIIEYVLNTTSFSSLGQSSYVFSSSLTTPIIAIEIPANLVSTQNLFYYNNLTNIIVNQNNTTLDSRDNCNCVIETATNTITLGSSNSIIPDSVTSIGERAFYYCSGLTGELVIPDSVTSIGNYAFYYCSGLTGGLVIPDLVTSIGNQAFYGCSGLTSVEIGSGCTSIDYSAFYQCSGLTSVKIGDGCTSIGNYTFHSCSGLTSVEIGSGCTSIGTQAFYNCSSLNKITCRAITAPSITNNTFSNVSPYGVLNYPEGSDYSSWLQNSSYYLGYYNWNQGNPNALIIRGYMTLSEPSSCRIIYNTNGVENVFVNGRRWLHGQNSNSFEAGSYTIEYVLKGTVISEQMFYDTSIDELIIPKGITEIQTHAFQASSLKRTSIPSGITFGYGIFQDAKQLTDITFEEGTTVIPGSTFYRCDNLKNVNLPNSLTTMNGCFSDCNNLEKLTVPVNVTGASPIHSYCQNLKEIYFYPQIAPNYSTHDQCAHNIKHYIPYGADYSSFLNSIYQSSYQYTFDTLNGEDEELNNVTLDGYDLAVVMKVFGPHETSLFNTGKVVEMSIDGVKLDAPVNTYTFSNSGFGKKHVIRYKLSQTYIQSHMFGQDTYNNHTHYCLPISEIVIGDRITSISYDAFRNCRDLKKITIGSGLTSISTSYDNSRTLRETTFYNCFQLESINISPLNPIFDSRDNCNCIIETATNTILLGSNNSFIPDSVTSIGSRAFYYCKGLTGELVIPDSVTSIGERAFENCSGLTSVEIGSGCASIGNNAFSSCSGLTSVEIGSGVTSIDKYAFFLCSGLTSVEIPDSVTSIGDNAFYGCSGLASVVIGSGCTSIGIYAFSSCSGLTSVVIGSGVTSIGERAFYQCSGLTGELVIPDSVTSISDYAFHGCSGLTSVVIGSGCTSIGIYAFSSCGGINEITCHAINAPSLSNQSFGSMKYYGTLIYPEGSDYSSWLQNSSGYLGYYKWNMPILKINITRNATAEQLNQGDSSRYTCFYGGSIVGLEIDGIPQNSYSTYSSLPGEHVFTVFVKEPIIPDDVYNSYMCSFITFLETNFEPVSIGKNNYFKYFKNGFKLGDYVSTSDIWTIPPSLTSLDGDFFSDQCTTIISYATTAPQIKNTNVFARYMYYGTLIYPEGSDYSSWLQNSSGYLGYYGWNEEAPRYKMTFNIKDISAPTVLFEGNGGTEIATAYFQKMYIDGIEYPVSQSHLFTSLGEHVVEFMMKRNTLPSLANCPNLIKLELPSHPSFTALTSTLVYSSGVSLNSVTIGYYYTQLKSNLANSPSKIKEIISLAPIAPTITSSTFYSGVGYYGTLIYPEGSDYSSWLQNSSGYLGYYGWNEEAPVLIAIYDVTTTGDTELCKSPSYIQEMYIDEVKVTPTKYYRFATLGKHTVKYIFNTNFYIPSNVFHLGYNSGGQINITELDISSKFTAIKDGAFRDLRALKKITCHATVAPAIGQNTFMSVSSYGTLIYPEGSDYSSWLNTNSYYLGYYHWNTPGIPFKVTYNVTDNQIPVKICNRPSEFLSLTINGKEVPLATTYLFDDVGEYTAEYRLKNNTIPASAFTSCYSLKQVEFNNDIEIIDVDAFSSCLGIEGLLKIPESIKTINKDAFNGCRAIKEIQIDGSPTIGDYGFGNCTGLQKITCLSRIAPTITYLTFYAALYYGDLYHYPGTGYETWLSTNKYYLGYYQWNIYQLYKPLTYYNLTITAEDVSARATNTIITWSYMTDGINPVTNEPMTGIQYTGITVSDSFDQNLSETETVERVITFEYMGMTASTTITQGVWKNQSYTVDLNSQWQLSTSIANPDSGTYEGVYESFSNKGKDSTAAIMYIDILGYETFQLYIRSYAESSYDYVMVSQLDQTINNNTSYSDTTLVKAHTRGSQQSGTAIGNYTLVEFTGIDGGEHRITVVYRKDGGSASGTDQGYVLIPKNQ